jgi:iron complex outermembrane receptor protein
VRRTALGLLLLLTNSADAQDAAEYGARAAVRRETRGPEVSVGDLRLQVGALARVPRADAQNLLTLAPGVLLTNHAGEGHASGMFMRGFDAGDGQNFETQLDGVPLNEVSNHHGHGYADSTFIPAELVDELRVIQGPFDPVQGDFAVAGTVDYQLALPTPGVTVKAALGSFRRRRLFLGYRPQGERRRTFVAVNLERGDGFGANRAFGKASGLGQYEAKVGAGTYLRTLAFAGAQRWDSAGVLREDDYDARALPCARRRDAQFFCTYDHNQGGSAQRAGLTTALERQKGDAFLRAQAFFVARSFRAKENFTGFSLDPRSDGPQRGDLRDGRTGTLTLGARALGRRAFQVLQRDFSFEAGIFVRHDIVNAVMDRVRHELDVPYLTDFDRNVRQTQIGAHARLDMQPWQRLRLSLGARADAFAYTVVDQNQAVRDRIGARLPRETTDAYGFALSPRASIDVALVDELHWLTSVGGGARSSDATALSESESAPFARIWAAESGLAYKRPVHTMQLEARLSGFYTRVSRDLVFDAEAGRNQPVGVSQRVGAMAMARLALASWFDVLTSVAYTRGHLTPRAAPWLSLEGPRVPFVPAWLFRVDGVIDRALPWVSHMSAFGAVGLGYVGPRPLPQAHWTSAYAVFDASVGLRYRFLELSAALTNLFDSRYRSAEFHYVSNWDPDASRSQVAARHFSAGAPRQWLVSLGVVGL